MLKHVKPGVVRRGSGALIAVLLSVGLIGVVYASTARPNHSVAAKGTGREPSYQLMLGIDITSEDAQGRHTRRADMAICTHPGEPASVKLADMDLKALLHARDNKHVSVKFDVNSSILNGEQSMQLAGPLGRPMHMQFSGSANTGGGQMQRIVLDATPIAGCPARDKISTKMRKVSVRDAATTVAAQAGWVLDNPGALSTHLVSFKFRDMKSAKAIHLLAQVDGKRAVFKGKHVRIESP